MEQNHSDVIAVMDEPKIITLMDTNATSEHIKDMHAGHDQMHTEMVFVFFLTLLVGQVILVEWKRRHYRSYQFVTLIGLWTIPFILAMNGQFWRFIAVWTVFSICSVFTIFKALEKPVAVSTPRLVYKWFYLVYKITYVIGVIGYIILMMAFLGVNFLFRSSPQSWMDCGSLFMFYGAYFGVLGLDLAEMCSDRMAFQLGYYTSSGMPTRNLEDNICAVCGNGFMVKVGEEGVIENTFQLPCNHVFHEFCIRGWCIVGKKHICPYCHEKVDLKRLFYNPWEKPHVFYGQLLDWIRWALTWLPVMFVVMRCINHLLGNEYD